MSPVDTYRFRSSSQLAAEHIREQIFTGELPAGAKVPQEDIARALDISRVPVREALLALQGEGYVTMLVNRGATVNRLSEDDVRDQFELRGYGFGIAARRAAGLPNAILVDRLAGLASQLATSDDPDDALGLIARFQGAILDFAGSQRLISAVAKFGTIVPGNFYRRIPGTIVAARRHADEQLAAQQARDPELAMRIATANAAENAGLVIAHLRGLGQL